ncbi:MAG: hypothetical protein JXR46_16235 [Calditrichaceae bacterium]|nr:hypothetical protein [Calditrichaceae bacterium]MBN2710594.1 hypothetical protein [Calditrichaceae bacterium]RQV94784.1 MAG: hypothetical protein EH224_09430 [Calditrichota bacterium]
MDRIKNAYLIIVFIPLVLFSQSAEVEDNWQPFRYFLGKWQGSETSPSGDGQCEREYSLILNNQYLYISSKTVFLPQEKNPEGEIHEHWTVYSYDRNKKVYIARQFNSEGFVNVLTINSGSANTDTLIFLSEKLENLPDGFKARLTIIKTSQNEFKEIFEIAPPNQDYTQFSTNTWKRVS